MYCHIELSPLNPDLDVIDVDIEGCTTNQVDSVGSHISVDQIKNGQSYRSQTLRIMDGQDLDNVSPISPSSDCSS